jgi:hypothetical protein
MTCKNESNHGFGFFTRNNTEQIEDNYVDIDYLSTNVLSKIEDCQKSVQKLKVLQPQRVDLEPAYQILEKVYQDVTSIIGNATNTTIPSFLSK